MLKMEILIATDLLKTREMLAYYLQEHYQNIEQIHFSEAYEKSKEALEHHDITICLTDHDAFFQYVQDNKPGIHCLFLKEKDKFEASLEALPLPKKQISTTAYSVVTLDFLQILGKLPCDVYIKLSQDKYLKCLNAGEIFQDKDRKRFQNKKVTRLFFKLDEDNQKQFTQALYAGIGRILQKKAIPLDEKICVVHTQVLGMVKLSGMTPELADMTKEAVVRCMNFISKNEILLNFWKKFNTLGDYPAKLYTLQSVLACLMLKELQWNSESTFFKIGLCSFLQNLTLINLKLIGLKNYKEFQNLENQLSAEEKKLFLDHPFKAKEVLSLMKGLPPDVDKIVFEQFELPDGSGYPRQLTSLTLGKLSCLFILSGYAARDLLNKGKDFSPAALKEALDAEGYNRGNFNDAYKILMKIFSIQEE